MRKWEEEDYWTKEKEESFDIHSEAEKFKDLYSSDEEG